MTGMTSHFGRNSKNGGSPPKDNNYVNIINFITVASLFVIKILLTNDTIDSFMAVSNVNTNIG
jgi:hypothetical protein